MLESRSEAINGRNRHKHLAKANAMKVNCQAAWVKEGWEKSGSQNCRSSRGNLAEKILTAELAEKCHEIAEKFRAP
jgi:hypothetical protein